MFRKTLAMLALSAGAIAPATAAVVMPSQLGSPATFAAPAGTTTITFESAVPANFTLTGGVITNTSVSGQYAQPAFAPVGNNYLAALGNPVNSATLLTNTSTGYEWVSFFLGSVDNYNEVDVLNVAGSVINTFTGSMFAAPATGSQSSANNNVRVNINAAGGQLIGGLRFRSVGTNATEVDNIVFAVPEPATWLTMILGFGLVGFAMRARRRNGVGAVFA